MIMTDVENAGIVNNWDTTSSLPDSAFAFTPGKDDHPIKVLGDTAQTTEASP